MGSPFLKQKMRYWNSKKILVKNPNLQNLQLLSLRLWITTQQLVMLMVI